MNNNRRLGAAGLLFIIIGVLLLLRTTGVIVSVSHLWPSLLIVLGVASILKFFFVKNRRLSISLGIVLCLWGIILIIANIVGPGMAFYRIWPVFPMGAGAVLFFFGYGKKASKYYSFSIPGIAIFLMSVFFLLFSLDIIKDDFRMFVVKWWPVLFIILGFSFFILSVFDKRDMDGDDK